jgi:hypothetical protein
VTESDEMIVFPAKDEFDAMTVTEMDFEIEPDESGLYVNLDSIRSTEFRENLLKFFQIRDGGLKHKSSVTSSKKFLFSGHRGSGKTMELKRLQTYLNHPDRYASMLIELEHEMEMSKFEPEDFYILMITSFAALCERERISVQGLDDLAKEWLQDEEITKEIKVAAQINSEAEANAKVSFFSLASLKTKLRTLLSYQSTTSKKLRQKVRDNPALLITRFNSILSEARKKLKANQAKDFLFIVDGNEKAGIETYKKLFLYDAYLIKDFEINAIFSIPIHSYFDIMSSAHQNFEGDTLPMLKIDADDVEKKRLYGDIVRKRVDEESLFEPGVIDYCVEMSGGCPRQLLRIVNRSLLSKRGPRVTLERAEHACRFLGQQIRDLLRSDHLKILRSGEFDLADEAVREMLYSLILLKYNGHREINPLLSRLGLLG